MNNQIPTSLLISPASCKNLELGNDKLMTRCKTEEYPLIAGIPWLLPNPQNSLLDWSIKLNHFYQVLEQEISELTQAVQVTSGQTRLRLEKLLAGKQSFLRTVVTLMSPIVRHPMAQKATYDALSDRPPSTQNLLSYEANLYRDWVWGDEENQQTANIVLQQLPDDSRERLLVLGAGAGRLALDIHESAEPALTIATDINPLLMLAANEILSGNDLTIYEFPSHPKHTNDVAVEHTIPGHKKPDNFFTIFADATKPCFESHSFSAVITPWLIDVQPMELNHFLQQLNQYIPVGGHWINFGSLVFNQKRDAFCYSIEEIHHIAERQGFRIDNIQQQTIPYLKSPYNAGYRMETVWSWRAEKIADVSPLADTQLLPNWLLDTSLAIPKAHYFQHFTQQHRVYAQLTAEVDGRTSVEKISKKLAKQQNMDADEAKRLVQQLFIDLYNQHN